MAGAARVTLACSSAGQGADRPEHKKGGSRHGHTPPDAAAAPPLFPSPELSHRRRTPLRASLKLNSWVTVSKSEGLGRNPGFVQTSSQGTDAAISGDKLRSMLHVKDARHQWAGMPPRGHLLLLVSAKACSAVITLPVPQEQEISAGH